MSHPYRRGWLDQSESANEGRAKTNGESLSPTHKGQEPSGEARAGGSFRCCPTLLPSLPASHTSALFWRANRIPILRKPRPAPQSDP